MAAGGYDWFQWTTEGLLMALVGAVGLVGNLTSVIIYGRQRVQRTFHRLLLTLAAFDTIYILSSIIMFALPMFFRDYTMKVKLYILPYMSYIIHMALLGSIYSTVALAVERYIAVCHPFVRYRKIYRSACFIVPVVVFPLLYNIPKAFELSVDASATPPLIQPTEMRQDKLYVLLYLVFLNFVVQILVPFTTLIVVNYRTYLTIKESEQNLASGNFSIQFKSSSRFRRTATTTTTASTGDCMEQQHRPHHLRRKSSTVGCSKLPPLPSTNKATSLRKREVVLSRISFYIVFVFLFCHSIRTIPNLYEMVIKCLPAGSEKPDFPYWVAKFANLSHLMITFSCSSNFYIYFVKYGGRKALNKRQLVFKFKFMSPSETSPPQLSCFNNSLPPSSVASQTQPSASALRLTQSLSISPSPTYSPRANRHRRHKSRTSSYVDQRHQKGGSYFFQDTAITNNNSDHSGLEYVSVDVLRSSSSTVKV